MRLIDRALSYAAVDVPVFPVSLEKRPLTRNGFKDATKDQSQISNWWRKWVTAGIGAPTGEASGLLVVDSDPRHGGDASLAELCEEFGMEWLENTLTVRSGGGGHHFYFQYPSGLNIRNSAGKLGEGLDVRGEGGYIILPPSPHPSGKTYTVQEPARAAPCPQWLIERLKVERLVERPSISLSVSFDPRAGPSIPAGERNEKLFKIACAMRGTGKTMNEIESDLLAIRDYRCATGEHPVTDLEVRKIACSVATRYAPNL